VKKRGVGKISANNEILIDTKTFKVFYNPCADNDAVELIGTGKNIKEAVAIAKTYTKYELGGLLEYGIRLTEK